MEFSLFFYWPYFLIFAFVFIVALLFLSIGLKLLMIGVKEKNQRKKTSGWAVITISSTFILLVILGISWLLL